MGNSKYKLIALIVLLLLLVLWANSQSSKFGAVSPTYNNTSGTEAFRVVINVTSIPTTSPYGKNSSGGDAGFNSFLYYLKSLGTSSSTIQTPTTILRNSDFKVNDNLLASVYRDSSSNSFTNNVAYTTDATQTESTIWASGQPTSISTGTYVISFSNLFNVSPALTSGSSYSMGVVVMNNAPYINTSISDNTCCRISSTSWSAPLTYTIYGTPTLSFSVSLALSSVATARP